MVDDYHRDIIPIPLQQIVCKYNRQLEQSRCIESINQPFCNSYFNQHIATTDKEMSCQTIDPWETKEILHLAITRVVIAIINPVSPKESPFDK